MPMAAVEALFFDLPVVASNIGGLPEIITTGKNGYLCSIDPVEFADNIHVAIKNYTQLKSTTGLHNEDLRSRFNLNYTIGQVRELYSGNFK